MFREVELNIKKHFRRLAADAAPRTYSRCERLLYLLLLEVEEVGRRRLHGRRGALGPPLPGPGVHVHASVLTGRPVAGRLGPRFLHHDLKTGKEG